MHFFINEGELFPEWARPARKHTLINHNPTPVTINCDDNFRSKLIVDSEK
jgi:hypothetical protein